jgi:hypothetical protein
MERAGLAAAEVARGMVGARGAEWVLARPKNNGATPSWSPESSGGFHEVVVVFGATRCACRRRRCGVRIVSGCRRPHGRRFPRRSKAADRDGLLASGSRVRSPRHAALVTSQALGAPILALDAERIVRRDRCRAGPAIRATATATFIALKPGLLTGDGVDLCGESATCARLDPEAIAGTGASPPGPPSPRLPPVRRGAGAACTRARSARSRSSAAPTAWSAHRSWRDAALKLGAGKVFVGFAAHEHGVDWMVPGRCSVRRRPRWSQPDALVAGPGLASIRMRPISWRGGMAIPTLDADA